MERSVAAQHFRAPAALAIAWVTLFVIGTDLFVVSPLLPLIAADYHVSPSAAGFAVAGFGLSYMVCAPLLGHIADRVGRRTVLIGCLLGFTAANLLSGAAATLPALIVARIVAGATAAGITPSIYALIGDAAPPARRATWLAITVSGLLLSLSLGAPLGALAGLWFGWSSVFVGLAAISAALLWVNARAWATTAQRGAETRAALPNVAFLAHRLTVTVLWSTALYGMYTYLGTGLTTAGFSGADVAGIVLLYGIGAVGGNLVGGYAADRFGTRIIIAASLVGLCIGFLALQATLQTGPSAGIGFCLVSAAAQLFFPAQQASLADEFATRRASVLAWNNAALFLGITLGSVIGGQMVAFAGFRMNLMMCAGIALAGWLAHVASATGPMPVAADSHSQI